MTYAILLTHFSRGAAWDQVESLLEEMHSKAMPARTTIYTVYIKELARTLQWNKALGLVMVMQELGAEVTPVIYNELLQVSTRATTSSDGVCCAGAVPGLHAGAQQPLVVALWQSRVLVRAGRTTTALPDAILRCLRSTVKHGGFHCLRSMH